MRATITTRLDVPWLRRVGPVVGPALAILVLQIVFFPAGDALSRVYVSGIVFGLLNALIAVGLALVYRANRILSFAQADLGTAPTVLAIGIVTFSGWSWFLALGAGVISAIVLGGVIEFVIIRRFFRSPRLILTVATIGVAQLLAIGSLLIPRIWGENLASSSISPPFDAEFTVGRIIYGPGAILTLVVAPLVLLAVALFLRFTSIGIAVRASAERADRAGLLGIPVQRLQTLVWALAALLSFVGVFLRANILPLPLVSAASLSALLAPLAALVLGRMTHLPAIVVSALALGVLTEGVVAETGQQTLVFPVLAGVILASLLLRRAARTRADTDQQSSWQAAEEVRPIPRELRSVPEVMAAKWGGLVLGIVVLYALPGWLGVGDQTRAAAVAIFAIVALSIVVLTGWAGQVSLGQMSFVGIGAAVGALATVEWNVDLGLSLLVAGVAGAAAAVVVGLPALRLRGLYLAVTTLAFALATSSYLLSRKHMDWIPDGNIERRPLLGTFDLSSERSMYYLSVIVLVLALVAVGGLRRSRVGRVLLAVRENERNAQAYGVNLTRVKLQAFAISGFLAAVAGCLLVHLSGTFDEFAYAPDDSVLVFTAAVVGGLGSMAGAVFGSLYLLGTDWFLPSASGDGQTVALVWDLLPTAVGVLLVLLLFPGGLGGLVYKLRDQWLRSVARRNAIVVPSLVADLMVDQETTLSAAVVAEEAKALPGADDGAGPDGPGPVDDGGGDPAGDGSDVAPSDGADAPDVPTGVQGPAR